MNFFPYNPLDIPALSATYTTAITGIASAFIPILFVAEILSEQTKIIKGEKPEYAKLIFNTFAVIFALLFLYKWIFLKIVASCEAVSMAMVNASDWSNFIQSITSTESLSLSIFKMNFTTFLAAFFSQALQIIELVFLMVRYVLLSLLYVIGPLAFVAGLSSMTRSFFKGWFINLFQISFWIVILKVIHGTLLLMNAETLQYGGSISDSIITGMIVTVMTILVPKITSAILSAHNLGLVGATTLTTITAISMKYGGHSILDKAGQSLKSTGKSASQTAIKPARWIYDKLRKKPDERYSKSSSADTDKKR